MTATLRCRCRVRAGILLLGTLLSSAEPAAAFEPAQETRNPYAGSIEAIRVGGVFFRRACGSCHGREGRGSVVGPDLGSGRWKHGGSDGTVFRVIRHGVPGTAMPAHVVPDQRIWQIIAYLRSVGADSAEPVSGDPGRGESLFARHRCSTCHMIHGRGGRLGPPLTSAEAPRSPGLLGRAIREPSSSVAEGYETVVLETGPGEQVKGIRKNEDTFSIQLLDTAEKLRCFMKSELRVLRHESGSLMPSYGEDVLPAADLQDILAYLAAVQRRERS